MSTPTRSVAARRRFLKLIGGSAALLPLATIHGCSGDEPAPPSGTAPAPAPPARDATAPAADAAPKAPAADAPLARLTEDDATARALGYRHDASQVDTARFPQHTPEQFCHNCALFQAKGGEEWAGCTIFPGRSVAANGWCSAWVKKA